MAKRVSARETTFFKATLDIKARGTLSPNESKLSLLRTSLRFYIALAILEPQVYLVVEQFGAENISLLSGRLSFYSVKLDAVRI